MPFEWCKGTKAVCITLPNSVKPTSKDGNKLIFN